MAPPLGVSGSAHTQSSVSKVAGAWETVMRGSQQGSAAAVAQLHEAMHVLKQNKLQHHAAECLLDSIEENVRQALAPPFHQEMQRFKMLQSGRQQKELLIWLKLGLPAALENLHRETSQVYLKQARAFAAALQDASMGKDLESRTLSCIRVLCFGPDPNQFQSLLRGYLEAAFESYRASCDNEDADWLEGEEEEEDMKDDDKDLIPREGATQVFSRLRDLGSSPLLEEALRQVITGYLQRHIPRDGGRFCGEYEEPELAMLCKWVQSVALGFVEEVLGGEFDRKGWSQHLDFNANTIFAKLRISELFNITRSFPESIPALKDLQASIQRTDLNDHLCVEMRKQLANRLLQAGASTDAIISTYIRLVKALRVYDPTSVTLEAVTGPTMSYLRSRSDTIRCIIRSLTEDSQSELYKELRRPRAGPIQEEDDSDEDAHMDSSTGWEPDPVTADPSKPSRSRHNTDIISMLVNIYGSKELFVSEYRSMLKDKLLCAPIDAAYDTEEELQGQEYLKLRFGEQSLEMCDFMLADIADSERINRSIKEKMGVLQLPPDDAPDSRWTAWVMSYANNTQGSHMGKFDLKKADQRAQAVTQAKLMAKELRDGVYLSSIIITRLCWPPLQEEEVVLPPRIQAVMDLYNDQYHVLKVPRKLQWKSNLGAVDVDLVFADRELSLRVTPIQATVLAMFEEQPEWNLHALRTALKMDTGMLDKCLGYLANQRVIEEERDSDPRKHMCRILETLPAATAEDEEMDMMAEDDCDDERGAGPQLDPQWEKIQSYVTGMLNVHGTAPLDRIHNMLRMFVSDPPYDRSIDELRDYLGTLVDKDVLDCTGDTYSIHS